MDTRNNYSKIIQNIIKSYTEIPYAEETIKFQTVFDTQEDHYLLMIIGREKHKINEKYSTMKRAHGCLIHVDIINDKIWIQYDGTEQGIAGDLLAAGIPKDRIVLAFYAPDLREETGFAVA